MLLVLRSVEEGRLGLIGVGAGNLPPSIFGCLTSVRFQNVGEVSTSAGLRISQIIQRLLLGTNGVEICSEIS
jgi:hypothetical protein